MSPRTSRAVFAAYGAALLVAPLLGITSGELFRFRGGEVSIFFGISGDHLQALEYGTGALGVVAVVALALWAGAPPGVGARRPAAAAAALCGVGFVVPHVLRLVADAQHSGAGWVEPRVQELYWLLWGIAICVLDVAAPALLVTSASRVLASSRNCLVMPGPFGHAGKWGDPRGVDAVRGLVVTRALYYAVRLAGGYFATAAAVFGTAVDVYHVVSDVLLAWLVIKAGKRILDRQREEREKRADQADPELALLTWQAEKRRFDPMALERKAERPAAMALGFATAAVVAGYYARSFASPSARALMICLAASFGAAAAVSFLAGLERVARALEAPALVTLLQTASALSVAAASVACVGLGGAPLVTKETAAILVVLLLPLAVAAPLCVVRAIAGLAREMRARWNAPQATAYRGPTPRW
jgi:hypothetical protein